MIRGDNDGTIVALNPRAELARGLDGQTAPADAASSASRVPRFRARSILSPVASAPTIAAAIVTTTATATASDAAPPADLRPRANNQSRRLDAGGSLTNFAPSRL
jgi:hypothetical protein